VVALAAMVLAVFVVANDFVSLSVALPQIEAEFDSNVSTIQWVINAYALVFGVLIIPGGRLADLFGRRKLFIVGAAIFAGFSVLGGAAQDDIWLIACRALMGIGGAIMWPATLGMTYAILPKSRAGLAGGLVVGAAGLGNACGPLIGGLLTDALSWRWILFINLPIAIVACLVILRTVPETRGDEEERRIDYLGIAVLSFGLVALLLALDEVTDLGWGDWRIILLLAICGLLLAAFVPIERRAGRSALIPGDIARNSDFRWACLAVLFMSPTFFVVLLYLPQFLEKLLEWSPLEAGVGLLPLMATYAVVSVVAGTRYERIGVKPLITVGAAAIFVGILLFGLVQDDSGYLALLPGMILFGIGVGLFYSTATTAAVTSLDPSRASLAGGVVFMFQVAGGSIGLGFTTMIFTSVSQNRLEDDAADAGITVSGEELDAVHGVLAGTDSAAQVLSTFPGSIGDRLVELVRDAFIAGMQWSFRVVAGLAFVGLVISALFVGGRLIFRPARAQEA
jgi:EmrB/QacA subfamily drug resistance transporter